MYENLATLKHLRKGIVGLSGNATVRANHIEIVTILVTWPNLRLSLIQAMIANE